MQHEHSGILVVDKPAGMTSAEVVAVIKKRLKAGKVGHTGTLDPFATGVLVCCVNRATKLARFFLHGNKKYEAVLCLGIETDTQDLTGNVTGTSDRTDFTDQAIRSVFKQFEGTVEQLPPVYSALKHKGAPLYKLARRGKPVQKPRRRVFIANIEILEINPPFVRFIVSCSAGTYVRTLCADIGAALGCGGHLQALRRLESSGFAIDEALSLSEVEALASAGKLPERIISMADALQDMTEYTADKALADKIMHGNILKKDVMPKELESSEGFIKIVDTNKDLIAVLESSAASSRYSYCCIFNNS